MRVLPPRLLPLLIALLLLLLHGGAAAQVPMGAVRGQIRDQQSGKPLAGVTVTLTGPALQGEQVEVTDQGGRYELAQLPPGDGYVVRFYFGDVTVERPGLRIEQQKTLTVSLAMPTHKGAPRAIVIHERAPNVDTASANTGLEISQEVLENIAVRGRTYESALTLAPGSGDVARGAGGDIGVWFSGATGSENAFLIDGLNTTDPSQGLLSVQLNHAFVKGVNVITGGYQAEYGRSTGGVVSVATKGGGNEFHGGIFASLLPMQLEPQTVARLGEALATRTRIHYQYDVGFDLGGPILKDRLWFYVGFAPTITVLNTDRVARTQVFDPARRGAALDPDYRCPEYLAGMELCQQVAGAALLTRELEAGRRQLREVNQLYNWIAKLQLNLTPDHNVTLSYLGSPQHNQVYNTYLDEVDTQRRSDVLQVHSVSARYSGKALSHRLQLGLLYGYHYQSLEQTPDVADRSATQYLASLNDPYSLADFEPVAACRRDTATGFNPCPITRYIHGGYGDQYRNQYLQRHALLASATYFLRAAGNHAIKLGFEFEGNDNHNTRIYSGTDYKEGERFSGHLIYQTSPDGRGLQVFRSFGQPAGRPFTLSGYPAVRCYGDIYCLDNFRAQTETRNFALYLRDSWVVGFLPGLTLNLGLRWEAQEIDGVDGQQKIGLYDNWAPRVAHQGALRAVPKKPFVGEIEPVVPLPRPQEQDHGQGDTPRTQRPTPDVDAAVQIPWGLHALESRIPERATIRPGVRSCPWPLPPAPVEEATSERVLYMARERIGVMMGRRKDGRVDMPDLFRVANLLKKGGTAPRTRTSPAPEPRRASPSVRCYA